MSTSRWRMASIPILVAGLAAWTVVTAPTRTTLTVIQLDARLDPTPPSASLGRPSQERPRRLSPAFALSLPSSAVAPTLIAATMRPPCLIAVGDPSQQMVHVLGEQGHVLGTFDGGGRAPRVLQSLSALAVTDQGRLVLGDAIASRLLIVEPPGWRVSRVVSLEPERGRLSPVSLAVVRDSMIVVASRLLPTAFASAKPFVKMVALVGRLIRYVGRVDALPGGPFTAAFGDAIVASMADSIVVAMPSIGVIGAVAATSRATGTQRVRLPTVSGRGALEYIERGKGDTLDQVKLVSSVAMLRSVAVDADHNWFLVQDVNGAVVTDERMHGFGQVIVAMPASNRAAPMYFAADEEVVALAATAKWIYAVVHPPASSRGDVVPAKVIAVRNPFWVATRDGEQRC